MTLERSGFTTAGAVGSVRPAPTSSVQHPAPVPRPSHRASPAEGTRTRRGTLAVTVATAGLVAILGLALVESLPTWAFDGGPLIALGGLAALAGTYLALALIVLVARVPWIEREVGHQRLVALHRKVAPYALVLIGAHVLLTTLGYAREARTGPLAELWTIVAHSAWMVPAATAFVLMVAMGVLSYRRIRARMSHETWWVAHLYFYLAVALAFGHQIELGSFFAGRPVQQAVWIGLYAAVALLVVGARVALPLVRSLRHDLRVADVVRESPSAVSVVITGRDLHRLEAEGGQFFHWRFLTRDWWWQAHPYSLSASPDGRTLRITVTEAGDQSAALASRLRPGLRVWAEGPYGIFTARRRHGQRVAAFAAGSGVTAVRSLLEDLPTDADVDVVVRARSASDTPLRGELEALASARGYRLRYVVGTREEIALTASDVRALVPDLGACDVFVCGPAGFAELVLEAAAAADVPAGRIHHEQFEL